MNSDNARPGARTDMLKRLGAFQSPAGWTRPNELLLASGARQKKAAFNAEEEENSEQEQKEEQKNRIAFRAFRPFALNAFARFQSPSRFCSI